MNCRSCTEYVMKFFDGSSNDIENAKMKQHLRSCSKCSMEYEQLKCALRLVETDTAIEPPPDFEENVMKKIYESGFVHRKSADRYRVLVYTTAAMLLSYIVIWASTWENGIADLIKQFYSFPDFTTILFGAVNTAEGFVDSLRHSVSIFTASMAQTYQYVILMAAAMFFSIQKVYGAYIAKRF